MRNMKFTTGAAVLGAAASLIVGIGAGSASAATGGGCSGLTAVGNGWKFNSCVSSSSGTVHSSATVTKGTQGSGCRVYVALIHNGVVYSETDSPCSATSFSNGTATGTGQWFTGTYVEEGSFTSSEVVSPVLKQ